MAAVPSRSAGGEELTLTMKLKRRAIHARCADEIAALYDAT